MATLSSARRSFVKTLRDWPRGTRKRGWGFLHDQIWFPVNVEEANVYMRDPNFDMKSEAVEIDGVWHRLYMDRKMLWHPFGTLRVHTFYQGDDDAAVHDHPWWFVTFPFRSYTETVQTMSESAMYRGNYPPDWEPEVLMNSRVVRAWRFHFRPALHRHFVHEPLRPFRTLIFTGRVKNDWSFFPEGRRVRHREWTSYNREVGE